MTSQTTISPNAKHKYTTLILCTCILFVSKPWVAVSPNLGAPLHKPYTNFPEG
ncbi:hypothetical protein ES319_A12G101500v1 [Gossypium barbadense]|uniref:Uncharacterized protein n=2 Tax=Gossypium TaxID=3633 RepID=A0A5J5TBR2_GOSBA|nr:hypothetical protein ES319_A12G101500v1 [Gossypium barbadense]TYG89568.1 hypothetical protein ES288_A12G109700v1 [Gossypium darwinii]